MKRYYIAVDIGGTNTRIALVDKRFKIIDKISFPTEIKETPKVQISCVVNAAMALLHIHKISSKALFGVGVGIAGLVEEGTGIVHNLTNIPGWRGINLARILKSRLKVPVYIDNDANLMTLAEFHKGAGRGSRNLVCITLGTGVGGGIVINGRLHRGSSSSAGEIGHIPINEKGPRCNCGGYACIERYVGNRYITSSYSNITPEEIFKKAKRGDRSAIKLWKNVSLRLGVMLTGVINLLDPDKIVIGGGVSNAGHFIFSPLKDTIKRYSMKGRRRQVEIVKARLGNDAGLIGAALLVKLERDK